MHVLYNKQNMDDLAAEAVGLGRQVAERAKALHLGDTAKDVAFVSRCFARLKALLHNYAGDSLHESSVIAGRHEQLGPYEVQDQELAFVQHSTRVRTHSQ